MNLPFRKDAVEKILRDVLRSGKEPTLEICGGITAMLGLHATGAKVPCQAATRLQTPSIIPWNKSFALVKESNSKGLLLAIPSEGLVNITTEEIVDLFPDGIDLLFVERKFGKIKINTAIKKIADIIWLVSIYIMNFSKIF